MQTPSRRAPARQSVARAAREYVASSNSLCCRTALGAADSTAYICGVSIGNRIFAAVYDPLSARWEQKYGAELKRKLLAAARGRVLELGVGTGLSFPHYAEVDELIGVAPSEPMLRRARRRAA